jgi:hypothetical protein
MKRFLSALAVSLLSSTAILAGSTSGRLTVGLAADAATATGTLSIQIAAPAGPANTMTVSDASGSGETNYPLQFGRPFLQGAIPSGQCPVVSVDGAGNAATSQADVKNRYPDGSVEYAVVATVVPSIPANGSVTLSFTSGTCNNAPLTATQMEDPAYNFDAAMTLAGTTGAIAATSGVIASPNTSFGTLANLNSITNGGMQITVGGKNYTVTGVNLSNCIFATGQPNDCGGEITAALSAVIPGAFFNGNGGINSLEIPTADGAIVNYPTAAGSGQDLSTLLGWNQSQGGTLTQGQSGSAGTPFSVSASALTMLQNGDYKLWTSGPVAQTIILGDDTPTRKYDLGFGDGYHPFRPHFEATFWPATRQVFVRVIGENDLSTELEDAPAYNLTITGGVASPVTEENLSGLTQPALTVWTKEFWLGGAPQAQVNIDNNLAYLESTRFVPNYDPTVTLSQATIAGDYANWWTNTGHDIGGSGAWQPGMGTTGARSDLGPEPSWDAAWLYTGDWRMRQTALGNADLAGWWSANTRETDPNAILNRGDAAGTGYGAPISISYRTYLGPSNGGEGEFLSYNSDNSSPPNKLGVVGAIAISEAGANAVGWQFDAAHEPSPFFIPYVLTGDPFYLDEMENWAAYDATEQAGACNGNQCRGPTGAEGGACDPRRRPVQDLSDDPDERPAGALGRGDVRHRHGL